MSTDNERIAELEARTRKGHVTGDRHAYYREDIEFLLAILKRKSAALEAAIEGLRAYAGCCDGCTCGDGWSHDAARETLAHLNTLAAEALGTKGEK